MSDNLIITEVTPAIGVAGGELRIHCRGFEPDLHEESKVLFGETEASIISASEETVIVRIPENAKAVGITIRVKDETSPVYPFTLAIMIATGFHTVTNPVIAPDGAIITTVSGSRGQQVSQPLVRLSLHGEKTPFPCEVMNPTGLAFGPDGQLYLTSRAEGVVWRYKNFEILEVVGEDLGIPCGIVFDSKGCLYVGDRSGTIHRLDLYGSREEFASLEPSVSAYHLAIDPHDQLYVTGPTLSTRDSLYRISNQGKVETVLNGLGRPQGMAVTPEGTLLLAATHTGKKGLFEFFPDTGDVKQIVSSPTLVGVAISGTDIFLADSSSVYWIQSGMDLSCT